MKRVYVCLAVAVLLLSSVALAQSAPPSADTYSNAGKNSTGFNYGTATLLVVQTNGSNSYLQFNLSTVPAGATINKATLRLFVDAMVTPGSFDVYQLNTGWFESTLTFNNAPPLGVSATGNHPVAVSKVNQFVMVDITSLVQSWQNGTIPNNGIALATTTATGGFSFDSKESTLTSHQPELEIVLSGVAGAQGPAGPQGPQGVTGNTGGTGPIGPAGATGNTGAAGPIGPQGIKGDTGTTGPQGIQGLTGNTGLTGAQGVAGPIGPQGTKGDTGAIGPQGTQGIQGSTGNTGATGAIGPQGPQGLTGAKGDMGTQGPQGIQGPIGNTGATGAVGPVGFTGSQGPAGNDGAAGTNGTGFNFTGLFNPSTAYNAFDVVTYQGSTYDATTSIPASTTTPDIAPGWVLMAQMGTAGTPGLTGPAGATGPAGSTGAPGATGAKGDTGAVGSQGPIGVDGTQGPAGPTGPQGLQGVSGDVNARMIFPSFYPGNLTGTWLGNQFTLDQAITVLRIAAVAKTATGAACPAAVFRLTNGTKGQDLVLSPGQNWSDTGAMVMTFAVGDVLQASLRTGSTCATNTGADANLLIEYKMQAAGDTDSVCSGTSCNGFCTTTSADPSNCGACGTACTSGTPCIDGGCGLASVGGACTSAAQCSSGTCTSGVCAASCPAGQVLCSNNTCVNEATDTNNCGACGHVCTTSNDTAACLSGACAIQSCNSGFKDCNNNPADGCEVNSNSDVNNCGGCSIKCTTGQMCTAGTCTTPPPTCSDGIKNGNETGIDCGGGSYQGLPSCPACGLAQHCGVDTDCSSNACDASSLTCVSNQCADHQKDGLETDVDCGGGICAACGLTLHCGVDTDCSSNACDAQSLLCVSNQCTDHRKDGSETDVDCGGSSCQACTAGQHCLTSLDCQAGHVCSAASHLCQ